MPSNKLVGKNGFAPMLLMLLAAAGVIAFLLFSSTASFKNKLFSSLYPKPASHASEPTISGNPETSFILELERDPNPPYPINPTPSNIQVGNNFRVDIYARSDFYAANLFVAKLNFPADAVEVVSIDERGTNSLATQWPEASFDNTTGKISIVGGVISPGVKTNANANYLFATIIFKAKKTSSVNVSFAPESAIYSNANNTNLLTEANNLRGVNFEVVDIAPTPTPTPTPPPAAPAVVSCTGTTVTGATLTQTTTGQVYTAIPTATVTFTANYTPTTNTTISWTGPSTGTFTTNSTTGISSWVVPTVTAAQSYTTKATITLNSATTDCPLINLSVIPPVVPPALTSACTFPQLTAAFGTRTGNAQFNSSCDLNSDGFIDITDYSLNLRARAHSCDVSDFSQTRFNATSGSKTGDANFDVCLDLDENGQIDISDFSLMVTAIAINTPPSEGNGDGNNDGKVNLVDLSILYTNFNKPAYFRRGLDLSGDGFINAVDFSRMISLLIEKGVIKGS